MEKAPFHHNPAGQVTPAGSTTGILPRRLLVTPSGRFGIHDAEDSLMQTDVEVFNHHQLWERIRAQFYTWRRRPEGCMGPNRRSRPEYVGVRFTVPVTSPASSFRKRC
jgi:hypothetical protein